VGGTVSRTSGVLDEASRTLRVEVFVPGGDVVLPGAFVYVTLHVPREQPAPVVPASALIVRKEGTLVAKVDTGGLVTLVPVAVGRDFGKELELLDGVAPGEAVIVQPPDTLETGAQVEIVPASS
jgi:multidrug efflux pump subunit AcrA (membrane-fusion protein)